MADRIRTSSSQHGLPTWTSTDIHELDTWLSEHSYLTKEATTAACEGEHVAQAQPHQDVTRPGEQNTIPLPDKILFDLLFNDGPSLACFATANVDEQTKKLACQCSETFLPSIYRWKQHILQRRITGFRTAQLQYSMFAETMQRKVAQHAAELNGNLAEGGREKLLENSFLDEKTRTEWKKHKEQVERDNVVVETERLQRQSEMKISTMLEEKAESSSLLPDPRREMEKNRNSSRGERVHSTTSRSTATEENIKSPVKMGTGPLNSSSATIFSPCSTTTSSWSPSRQSTAASSTNPNSPASHVIKAAQATDESCLLPDDPQEDAVEEQAARERVIVHETVPESWKQDYKSYTSEMSGTSNPKSSSYQQKPVKPFLRDQLLRQQAKQWDIFYKNNTVNFFKDRHYLGKEFVEPYLQDDKILPSHGIAAPQEEKPKLLLEIGCGVGNSILPLMELLNGDEKVESPTGFATQMIHPRENFWNFVACDHSKVAIKLLNEKLEDHPKRDTVIETMVLDATSEMEPEDKKQGAVEQNQTQINQDGKHSHPHPLAPYFGKCDAVLLLFVLSAIEPKKQQNVAKLIAKLLKPKTGLLLFRDYAKFDWAEMRFQHPLHKPCLMLAADRKNEEENKAATACKPDGTCGANEYATTAASPVSVSGGEEYHAESAEARYRGAAQPPANTTSGVVHEQAKNHQALYKRHDGTLAYFFDYENKELERKIFTKELGFAVGQNSSSEDDGLLEHKIVCREITNRKENKVMRRMWLQAVFRKS
ncbi:unnamed protein product [Amoebophrya sp. A120]|nr:unnamed protein product [Amoebophrya sp. A120]|eukprot:GSA120T00015818001.1